MGRIQDPRVAVGEASAPDKVSEHLVVPQVRYAGDQPPLGGEVPDEHYLVPLGKAEMRDLIGVLNREYERKPYEGEAIGSYKIFEVKYWMRRVRLGVRALKKELKNTQR